MDFQISVSFSFSKPEPAGCPYTAFDVSTMKAADQGRKDEDEVEQTTANRDGFEERTVRGKGEGGQAFAQSKKDYSTCRLWAASGCQFPAETCEYAYEETLKGVVKVRGGKKKRKRVKW